MNRLNLKLNEDENENEADWSIAPIRRLRLCS